jgi:hypothetical protein
MKLCTAGGRRNGRRLITGLASADDIDKLACFVGIAVSSGFGFFLRVINMHTYGATGRKPHKSQPNNNAKNTSFQDRPCLLLLVFE